MTFKELKNKIKEEQKILAQSIKRGRYLRKPGRRTNLSSEDKKFFVTYGNNTYYANWRIDELSNKYRHRHIVYCTMFNGTSYSSIENPREGNSPNGSLLDIIRKDWESLLNEETLRDCA
jgi:hypothetical protein